MRIESTPAAQEVIAKMQTLRTGTLTVTIGTGCCESTAPFLYEDFWPGPDQEAIGTVNDVAVYAPEYLRDLYPGEDQVVWLDVVEEPVESLSIETELGQRLVLRGAEHNSSRQPTDCAVAPSTARTAGVTGQLPEALRALRVR